MRQLFFGIAMAVLAVPEARAQTSRSGTSAPGTVFVQGGVLITSILSEKQDAGSGYLHLNLIGSLDWPASGVALGGGVFAARHVSVGGELGLRRPQIATFSEQEHGHTDSEVLSSTYTSRERLLSFLVRYHAAPAAGVDVQPLGGVTLSFASQSLTGRRGVYYYPTFPPTPVSGRDVVLDTTKYGVVGGADVTLRAGRGVAVVCAPRIHWIHRDWSAEYDGGVPHAGRVIVSVAAGVRWQPRKVT